MFGMVRAPVETVLATEDPEIVPKKAEETTETFAGPPVYFPARIVALSMNSLPSPVLWAITPNNTK